MGVFAFGGLAVGVVTVGVVGLGLLFCMACFAIGAIASGGIAVGLAARGGVAAGIVSLGGFSVGMLARGGFVLSKYAFENAPAYVKELMTLDRSWLVTLVQLLIVPLTALVTLAATFVSEREQRRLRQADPWLQE